jgi:hypothetical protein
MSIKILNMQLFVHMFKRNFFTYISSIRAATLPGAYELNQHKSHTINPEFIL